MIIKAAIFSCNKLVRKPFFFVLDNKCFQRLSAAASGLITTFQRGGEKEKQPFHSFGFLPSGGFKTRRKNELQHYVNFFIIPPFSCPRQLKFFLTSNKTATIIKVPTSRAHKFSREYHLDRESKTLLSPGPIYLPFGLFLVLLRLIFQGFCAKF